MKSLTTHFAGKLFQAQLKARNLSEKSIAYEMEILKKFFKFITERCGKRVDLRQVGLKELVDYSNYLNQELGQKSKQPLGETYKVRCLAIVKLLYKCLYMQEYLLTNPLQEFAYKQKREAGKRAILSTAELARVLDGIDLKAPGGQRDKTLYELMYGTGLRLEEVRKLRLIDIDFAERMLFVQGKGGKPRLQPVSATAFLFLKNYIGERERQSLEPVFRGEAQGGLMGRSAINLNFQKWVRKAGIKRKGVSSHSIRHSVGTHLLENGANIRYVQAFLGHQSLKTTTIYTHMLYKNLKRIYKSLHPRENAYYREVDAEYRLRIEALKERLRERNADTERKRAHNQRSYQLKKLKAKGQKS